MTDADARPIIDLDRKTVETFREPYLWLLTTKLIDGVLIPGGFVGQAEAEDRPLSDGLRVTCGWPSSGGLRKSKTVIGECWPQVASADNTTEIFISPKLDNAMEIAGVIIHELLHASLGTKQKHNRRFAAACAKLGLEGKPTTTVIEDGSELAGKVAVLLADMPPYPHKSLTMTRQKETGRMLLCYCANEECDSHGAGDDGSDHPGFKFRITRKWAERYASGEQATIQRLDEQPSLESGAHEVGALMDAVKAGQLVSVDFLVSISCPDCEEQMHVEYKGKGA